MPSQPPVAHFPVCPEATYVPDPCKADGKPVLTSSTTYNIYQGGQAAPVKIKLQEPVWAYCPVAITGCRADSRDLSTFGKLAGLAASPGNSGEEIEIVHDGEVVNSSWEWTPGCTVFLSGEGLSDQFPTTGYIQQVGIAKSSTALMVHLGQPIQI